MQVILLEKVIKLGETGSVVEVKNGFARNYLIPRKKAMRATKQNIEFFEIQRAEIEQANADKKLQAEALVEKFTDLSVTINRQAGDDGKLYGSVSNRDIANAVSEKIGYTLESECVHIPSKIKTIGISPIEIVLHPEVRTEVQLNIVRSEVA